jgi:hypothetical protein
MEGLEAFWGLKYAAGGPACGAVTEALYVGHGALLMCDARQMTRLTRS